MTQWMRGFRHGRALLDGGQVNSEIGDLLFAETHRLRLHRRMPALALAVLGQGLGQVLLGLATDLRYPVTGVGVLVTGDAVATLAGVGQHTAIVETAGGRGSRRHRGRSRCRGGWCCRSRCGLCGGPEGQEDGQSETSGERLRAHGVFSGDSGLVVPAWGTERPEYSLRFHLAEMGSARPAA
ncbi:hypothetical protein BN1263170340 [Stenotrophomonas indicatrix]|nr:hypothetical protein BN1263170340 [Stenotrophomonas indicatrix]